MNAAIKLRVAPAPGPTRAGHGPFALDGAARVLLADDDPTVRRVIARVLRNDGFEVIEARDGAEALEIAAASMPDLALIDLCMPRLGGLEVVQQLKRRSPRMPVLVLSGMDDPEERVEAFDVGADDFISKPVHMPELLRRVGAFERTRRVYIDLKAANERADRLRLFNAEAAALLAHDLNNGLSIASANLQFIDEELEKYTTDEEMVDALHASRRALRRMIGLVSNFVDISRLEDAALEANRSPTPLPELLTLAAQIHETHIGIEIDCEPGLVASLDPMLVERTIHNLLNNATRYVSEGGRIRIQVKLDDRGDALTISVGNTGVPVPHALRTELFAKYKKGSDGKAQRGMGLYFCRLACEAHGGRISLEDDPEFATLFVLHLPLGA